MACVGVLSLQGGFRAHARAVREIGLSALEVRDARDLERADGLVLPGGESTAQLRLLERHGLEGALAAFVAAGRPVLATCAGLILAARAVVPAQRSFGWLDVEVLRNAHGRQLESFEDRSDEGLPLVFIRAPRISAVGGRVAVLARWRGEPVLVRQGAVTGAAFHPELTPDRRVHRLAFEGLAGGAQLHTAGA
jgi:5'-phosphate synthase pdxT subunit